MQFVIIAYDDIGAEAQKRRAAAREAHLLLGDQMRDRGEALYGAAILDESNQMIGSIYVVDFLSRDAVNNWLKIEPYVKGKVWKDIEIKSCRVGPSFQK